MAWADAVIIQAVADALNVTIQIVESDQGFAPLTTVNPVQERTTSSTITIGHIGECHYVSTTALQSNASISMYIELTNDTQSSINHFIMSIYAVCFSVIKSCTYWDSSTLQALHEHACLFFFIFSNLFPVLLDRFVPFTSCMLHLKVSRIKTAKY